MKKILSFLLILTFASHFIISFAIDEPSYWASDGVSAAINEGIIPSALYLDDGSFHAPITRLEFASIMATISDQRIKNGTFQLPTSTNTQSFSDTEDISAMTCAKLGIIKGYAGGVFSPDKPISRQESAVMLSRAYAVFSGNAPVLSQKVPHVFQDGERISSWSRDSINFVYRQGVMQGTGHDLFDPTGSYTREQAILTALRLWNLLSNKANPAPLEYYPNPNVYDYNPCVSFWLDSNLTKHTTDELGVFYPVGTKYACVIDNVGVGSTFGHIINQKGEKMLSDFLSTSGFFYDMELNGSTAKVVLRNSFEAYTINLDTGEVLGHGFMGDQDYPLGQNDTPISNITVHGNNGFYTIVDAHGKALSKTYPNALYAMDQFLFAGWVSDTKYDLLYCDGKNPARLLRTEPAYHGRPGVSTDGHGVYAMQITYDTILLFDLFGDTLGTIKLDQASIYYTARMQFYGGLLLVCYASNDQSSTTCRYYSFDGTKINIS